MRLVWSIAGREFSRLRSRFSGRARPIVLIVVLITLMTTYVAYRQQAIRGRSLYRVGVTADAPQLTDPRFYVVELSSESGRIALDQGDLDVFIDGVDVMVGFTDAAAYAAGTLRLYLEGAELARISESYPAEEAFPLHVEMSAFPSATDSEGARSESEIVVPSLMSPPMPFEDVLKVSVQLVPLFLVSVFFTSGLMEERRDRRVSVLLSTPVSPLQVIVGKTLPYVLFAMASVLVSALLLGGNPLLALGIFFPVILFVFSITLMVPLLYRTFSDTTFISMFVTVVVTLYLLFPAMLLGVSDFSYVSPLSLAVEMYQGKPLALRSYLTAAIPMVLIFVIFVYVGSRILNEEYLTRYRPIVRKLAEAVYLAMDRRHPAVSVLATSLCLVPVVYLAQLGALAVALNLPVRVAMGGILVASVVIEEVAKSVGIAMLIENGDVRRPWVIVLLAFLSAVGFLIGEKALLLVSIQAASQSLLAEVLLNAGKLWITLAAHFVFTLIVTLSTRWWGAKRYPLALAAGAAVHFVYNLSVLGLLG